MTISVPWYGWKPDLPDARDFAYRLRAPGRRPPVVDLRAASPPVYDQGAIGSCTGNSVGSCVQFALMKQGPTSFVPSRLFLYWNGRNYEGNAATDSGAQIRDVIKGAVDFGSPPETDWPYDVSRFADKPPQHAYDDGLGDVALTYERLDSFSMNEMFQRLKVSREAALLEHLQDCLASGFPFAFGFSVYESFESEEVARSGVVQTPGATERMIGGHAVAASGYVEADRRFIVKNSWGSDWGMGGYFTIPYDYVLNSDLAADFWSITMVGKQGQQQ